MKFFIVNVNNCLPMSQYAPFFYEHIYKGDLVMLEDIEDTCQLEKTYWELLSHMNRKPFPKRQGVILLFIPRDFALPLRPQNYEIYNDINTYMHLLQQLDDDFKVYTFYVDRTGELEENDAVYQKLSAVNKSLQAKYPELDAHFLSLDEKPESYDYKQYLGEKISRLCDCMQPFHLQMLKNAPDMEATPTHFQNGINNYIGEAQRLLSEVKHLYAPIYRLELADEIEQWLKIVFYIKALIKDRLLPEQLADFEHYSFEQADHVRRLLATYRGRLSSWDCSEPAVSKQGISTKWEFRASSNAAAVYKTKIVGIVETELKKLNLGRVGSQDLVDGIFQQLNGIVTDAWDDLQTLTEEQSKLLLDPDSYQEVSEEPFRLDESDREDVNAEKKMLEQTNQHSPGAADIPDFSAENRLEQELEQINHQIKQILENMRAYSGRIFFLTLLCAIAAVGGLYLGAQYSIFIKENSWWIFGAYLLACATIFSGTYTTVRWSFLKEIRALLSECTTKVTNFLQAFQLIAENFEQNIHAAGQYNCLKRQIDAKAAARKKYQQTMQKYAWHKMKVKQILRNMAYFESFIGDAYPYEEGTVTLDLFDHDAEHTEFYHLKVFRRE